MAAGPRVTSKVRTREVPFMSSSSEVWGDLHKRKPRGFWISHLLHLQVKERYAGPQIRLKQAETGCGGRYRRVTNVSVIVLTFHRSVESSSPPRRATSWPMLCVGTLSFLGLSGVYCKQRRSCPDLAFWQVHRQLDPAGMPTLPFSEKCGIWRRVPTPV